MSSNKSSDNTMIMVGVLVFLLILVGGVGTAIYYSKKKKAPVKKYKCDVKKANKCSLEEDGTYETEVECLDECKKFKCNLDAEIKCEPSDDGTHNTKSDCEAACMKYACNKNKDPPVCEKSEQGTFDTRELCEASICKITDNDKFKCNSSSCEYDVTGTQTLDECKKTCGINPTDKYECDRTKSPPECIINNTSGTMSYGTCTDTCNPKTYKCDVKTDGIYCIEDPMGDLPNCNTCINPATCKDKSLNEPKILSKGECTCPDGFEGKNCSDKITISKFEFKIDSKGNLVVT